MLRDDPTLNPYFRGQTDPVTGDKRGIVIPRSSLRRKVIALDNPLTEQQFRVEGDFIYFDQNSTGLATIKLNNTSEDPWPASAAAGVTDIPYTDIFLTASGQAGKVLNMWYGYRARFLNPQQAIATIGSITNPVGVQGPRAYSGAPLVGDLPVLAREVGFVYGTSFVSNASLTASVSQQIFAVASNLNGAIIWRASLRGGNGAGVPRTALAAHTAAPNGVTVGDVLASDDYYTEAAAPRFVTGFKLERPVFVPAGKGAFFTSDSTETTGMRSCLYTLL